jgi:protease PrsW
VQLFALSLAPVALLFWFFYVRDKYEKEPPALLVRLFAFGAFSVLPAIAFSLLLGRFTALYLIPGTFNYLLIENYLVIGFIEEMVKLYVVVAVAYGHPAYNEPYDGIIYAVTAALGFAAVENIMYVYQGGLAVGVARMLLAVPAHALFGSFMGHYLSRSKFSSSGRSSGFMYLALIVPALLHGTYNSLLSTGRLELAVLVVPLSLYMWRSALKQGARASLQSPFRPET